MENSKRRAHPRVPARIEVLLRTSDGRSARTEIIENISLGGVYIGMDDPPGFGAEVDLEFSLPSGPRNIRCKGVVVWSTRLDANAGGGGKKGIGVRLMQASIADMRILSDFIQGRLVG